MKHAVLACASLLLLAACAPKLPEAYGIYVSDHDTYTPLTTSGAPPAISTDASILIFDKTLTNLPAADLAKMVYQRFPVRVGVEVVFPSPRGGTPTYHFYKSSTTYVWSQKTEEEEEPGSIHVAPVEGHPDMVKLYRDGGFAPGGYGLLVPGSNRYLFGADLPSTCMDEFTYAHVSTGLQSFLDAGRGRTADGNAITNVAYKPCADIDRDSPFATSAVEDFLRRNP